MAEVVRGVARKGQFVGCQPSADAADGLIPQELDRVAIDLDFLGDVVGTAERRTVGGDEVLDIESGDVIEAFEQNSGHDIPHRDGEHVEQCRPDNVEHRSIRNQIVTSRRWTGLGERQEASDLGCHRLGDGLRWGMKPG